MILFFDILLEFFNATHETLKTRNNKKNGCTNCKTSSKVSKLLQGIPIEICLYSRNVDTHSAILEDENVQRELHLEQPTN